jgi:hypothetical protein
MKLNPIPFMIATLKAIPGLTGVQVSSTLINHQIGDSAIEVTLAPGGKRVVHNRMDAFRFTLDHYGPSKKAAGDQAFLVREYLLENLPGTYRNGIAVDEVKEDDLPWEIIDPESREQRFIHRITIYLYQY